LILALIILIKLFGYIYIYSQPKKEKKKTQENLIQKFFWVKIAKILTTHQYIYIYNVKKFAEI
jgi:hypothetical protein